MRIYDGQKTDRWRSKRCSFHCSSASPSCLSLLPSSPEGSWRHVCGSAASSRVNRRVSPPAACQTPLNLSLLGSSAAACKVLAKVFQERVGGEKPQADWGWRGKACLWRSLGVPRINRQPETIKTSMCLRFWRLYIWIWLMLVFGGLGADLRVPVQLNRISDHHWQVLSVHLASAVGQTPNCCSWATKVRG